MESGLRPMVANSSCATHDLVDPRSVGDDGEQALNDFRASATSRASTFAVWQNMPREWERFRAIRGRSGRPPVHHAATTQSSASSSSWRWPWAGQCVSRPKYLGALDLDRITFAMFSDGCERRVEQLATAIIPARQRLTITSPRSTL